MPFDKRQAEEAVATEFLDLYNPAQATNFKISSLGDAPDVECEDAVSGLHLSLEVSLLEDIPGFMESVLAGKPKRVSPHTHNTSVTFENDVLPLLEERVGKKLLSSYGPRTALVLKDLTPLMGTTEWSFFKDNHAKALLAGRQRNYGAGIWVICTDYTPWPNRSLLFCLSEPAPPSAAA